MRSLMAGRGGRKRQQPLIPWGGGGGGTERSGLALFEREKRGSGLLPSASGRGSPVVVTIAEEHRGGKLEKDPKWEGVLGEKPGGKERILAGEGEKARLDDDAKEGIGVLKIKEGAQEKEEGKPSRRRKKNPQKPYQELGEHEGSVKENVAR